MSKVTAVITCYNQGATIRATLESVRAQTYKDVSIVVVGSTDEQTALMRKTCWQQAGGYREGMTQGYEDWDFYISVTKRGWRVEIIESFLLTYSISASSSNTAGYRIRP